MKEYCKIDSQVMSILMKPVNEDKFINTTFMDCFAVGNGEEYLVVLREFVVLMEVVKRKVIWSVPLAEVECQNVAGEKKIVMKGKKVSVFHVIMGLFSRISSKW